ncbi:MAG TPA: response regulator transcription factor [Gaiellaceae bacterium]|nr:response regulator transcription factor [Gaiellaceae bacterium]
MNATAQLAWGPTVLLVEDEESIAGLLRSYLSAQGFRIVWVRSGEEALAELERHPIRVVLLDLGLPGMDGFDVCRQIRYRSKVPLVMVTARDEEIDRVAGLEIGADDYVSKPFSPRELAARLKAVLRRSEDRIERAVLSLEDVVLNRERREVTVAGRPVALTAKEFDLLAFLLEQPGIVFSRELLLERVWGFDYPTSTRTVDMHVASLRRKLDRPELVQTVRGVGYKARGR